MGVGGVGRDACAGQEERQCKTHLVMDTHANPQTTCAAEEVARGLNTAARHHTNRRGGNHSRSAPADRQSQVSRSGCHTCARWTTSAVPAFLPCKVQMEERRGWHSGQVSTITSRHPFMLRSNGIAPLALAQCYQATHETWNCSSRQAHRGGGLCALDGKSGRQADGGIGQEVHNHHCSRGRGAEAGSGGWKPGGGAEAGKSCCTARTLVPVPGGFQTSHNFHMQEAALPLHALPIYSPLRIGPLTCHVIFELVRPNGQGQQLVGRLRRSHLSGVMCRGLHKQSVALMSGSRCSRRHTFSCSPAPACVITPGWVATTHILPCSKRSPWGSHLWVYCVPQAVAADQQARPGGGQRDLAHLRAWQHGGSGWSRECLAG